jgi:hypothetical protein
VISDKKQRLIKRYLLQSGIKDPSEKNPEGEIGHYISQKSEKHLLLIMRPQISMKIMKYKYDAAWVLKLIICSCEILPEDEERLLQGDDYSKLHVTSSLCWFFSKACLMVKFS